MPNPDMYTIEGEKLQLKQVIQRCESLAKLGQGVFVGREAIRARLRRGVRRWQELVSPIQTRKDRIKNHCWKSPLKKQTSESPRGPAASPAKRPVGHRFESDTLESLGISVRPKPAVRLDGSVETGFDEYEDL